VIELICFTKLQELLLRLIMAEQKVSRKEDKGEEEMRKGEVMCRRNFPSEGSTSALEQMVGSLSTILEGFSSSQTDLKTSLEITSARQEAAI
jgi:hypothetical protein